MFSPVRIALIAILLLAGNSHAAELVPAATKNLDAYFDALSRESLANGSIAISEKGVVKYQRSVGLASITPRGTEPADTNTRYRIGSVTKLFTAALTMQLVERASITLDSKLAEFYPELPNALDITYRDLLQHRSGLSNYTEAAGFELWRTKPKPRAELLKLIADGGARFAPRQRLEYNNSNYLLLGFVLEKIHNKPYADILDKGVVGKVPLTRTESGAEFGALPVSYEKTPQGWKAVAATDPDLHGGAGSLTSTPTDLVRFIDALFAGRVVSQHSLASMRDQSVGTGLGLWVYDVAGRKGYGHGGAVESFRACVFHFPEQKVSIAYATNAPLLSMSEIVDEVLALVFDGRRKPPAYAPLTLSELQQKPIVGGWRSAEGTPNRTSFRQFRPPDSPIELEVRSRAGGPIVRIRNSEMPLIAFGDGEFFIREIGYFLRFDSDELVVRGPDYAYYLKKDLTKAE
ncbi:MAG: beta-lactamase family protein [Steroidobacteraceae bacterium]|nr:beta-lactamase family protein [Steroidobacteraceae bacterium]